VILEYKAALIQKICVNKFTRIYSQQSAASKMFNDAGGANSSFSPVDFSKIGKFTSLG
jgi:hypothetical protein